MLFLKKSTSVKILINFYYFTHLRYQQFLNHSPHSTSAPPRSVVIIVTRTRFLTAFYQQSGRLQLYLCLTLAALNTAVQCGLQLAARADRIPPVGPRSFRQPLNRLLSRSADWASRTGGRLRISTPVNVRAAPHGRRAAARLFIQLMS